MVKVRAVWQDEKTVQIMNLRGTAHLGVAALLSTGWKVIPNQAGRRPSRHRFETPYDAICSYYGKGAVQRIEEGPKDHPRVQVIAPKEVWRRDVISHEECESCDIETPDPICAGKIIEQAIIHETPQGFTGCIGESLVIDEPTLERAIEVLSQWLGDQGWWVGPEPLGGLTVQQLADLLEEGLTQDSHVAKHLWAELGRRGWELAQSLPGSLG